MLAGSPLGICPLVAIDLIRSYNEFLCLTERSGPAHEVERKSGQEKVKESMKSHWLLLKENALREQNVMDDIKAMLWLDTDLFLNEL